MWQVLTTSQFLPVPSVTGTDYQSVLTCTQYVRYWQPVSSDLYPVWQVLTTSQFWPVPTVTGTDNQSVLNCTHCDRYWHNQSVLTCTHCDRYWQPVSSYLYPVWQVLTQPVSSYLYPVWQVLTQPVCSYLYPAWQTLTQPVSSYLYPMFECDRYWHNQSVLTCTQCDILTWPVSSYLHPLWHTDILHPLWHTDMTSQFLPAPIVTYWHDQAVLTCTHCDILTWPGSSYLHPVWNTDMTRQFLPAPSVTYWHDQSGLPQCERSLLLIWPVSSYLYPVNNNNKCQMLLKLIVYHGVCWYAIYCAKCICSHRYRQLIVPPNCVELMWVGLKGTRQRHLVVKKVRHPDIAGWTPLVVIGNRQSGNNDGEVILRRFRSILNTSQVGQFTFQVHDFSTVLLGNKPSSTWDCTIRVGILGSCIRIWVFFLKTGPKSPDEINDRYFLMK